MGQRARDPPPASGPARRPKSPPRSYQECRVETISRAGVLSLIFDIYCKRLWRFRTRRVSLFRSVPAQVSKTQSANFSTLTRTISALIYVAAARFSCERPASNPDARHRARDGTIRQSDSAARGDEHDGALAARHRPGGLRASPDPLCHRGANRRNRTRDCRCPAVHRAGRRGRPAEDDPRRDQRAARIVGAQCQPCRVRGRLRADFPCDRRGHPPGRVGGADAGRSRGGDRSDGSAMVPGRDRHVVVARTRRRGAALAGRCGWQLRCPERVPSGDRSQAWCDIGTGGCASALPRNPPGCAKRRGQEVRHARGIARPVPEPADRGERLDPCKRRSNNAPRGAPGQSGSAWPEIG